MCVCVCVHATLHGRLSALCRREYMHLCATVRGIMLKLIFGSKTEHEIETTVGHHLNIVLTSFGNRFWNLLDIIWESFGHRLGIASNTNATKHHDIIWT